MSNVPNRVARMFGPTEWKPAQVIGVEGGYKVLAQCFRIAGADGDGAGDERLAERAVQAVTDLRRDYDEACEEAHQLYQRAERAEAEAARLRELLGETRDYVADAASEEAVLNRHRSPARHHKQEFLAKIDAALKDTQLTAAPAPAEPKPAEGGGVDKRALSYALNCLGMDNDCNTPDWKLADMIAEKMAEWPALTALRGDTP